MDEEIITVQLTKISYYLLVNILKRECVSTVSCFDIDATVQKHLMLCIHYTIVKLISSHIPACYDDGARDMIWLPLNIDG